MPIHDHGYARYQGTRTPPGRAWAVIAGSGIRGMLAARPFLLVLLFAWLQFFVRAVMLYLAANVPQADVIAPSPATFREFFDQQGFFVFVVAVYAGAGLIANDRRANALQIYLSKPVTRIEYVAGKLAVVMAFLAFVTWVPAVLLLGLQTMFTGSLAFVREHAFLIPAITLFGFLQVLLASITMLALSSLSSSARYVGMLYAGAVIFSEAVFQTLRGRHRRHRAVLGLVRREPGPGGGRHLSGRTALRHAVGRVPAVRRGPDRPVGLGARPAGAGRGDRHVSRPVVVADRMSKWYGQVIGLNDVTVSIPPGISGLLGPNGAGKSTLLKLVTGQLKPSKGRLQVLGEPIWGNPGAYRRIGYCPDHDAFYERMTGRDWLTALLGLSGFDGERAAGAAERTLDRVGLAAAADRRIGGYSKGMRQRIKLAQAIAHEPELLVLDEPLAGLDPIGRRRVIDVIKAWGRDGRSVVVSSHVLHEIELMTSNILLLHNGRILAEGNVHQIRDLIDEHPHTVRITAGDPRRLARHLLGYPHVIAMQLQDGAVVAQTSRPDAFYTELTALAAGEEAGTVGEVTSPDDNLQAVFSYLVEH